MSNVTSSVFDKKYNVMSIDVFKQSNIQSRNTFFTWTAKNYGILFLSSHTWKNRFCGSLFVQANLEHCKYNLVVKQLFPF